MGKACIANHFAAPQALQPYSVLLVSARREDHDSLEKIFCGSRVKLLTAWTGSDALTMIRLLCYEIPVVICEHSLPDGDWKLLLAELQRTAAQSRIIVCARLADEHLWVEVLNLGAFDLLLCAPFVADQVVRATEGAWSAWDRARGPRVVPQAVNGVIQSSPAMLAAGSPV